MMLSLTKDNKEIILRNNICRGLVNNENSLGIKSEERREEKLVVKRFGNE